MIETRLPSSRCGDTGTVMMEIVSGCCTEQWRRKIVRIGGPTAGVRENSNRVLSLRPKITTRQHLDFSNRGEGEGGGRRRYSIIANPCPEHKIAVSH